MSAITVFSNDSSIVSFEDKKGNAHNISAEGALFKGGLALKALKDVAVKSAYDKAINGKFRAAADIMAAAFPSTGKAFEKIMGSAHANKSAFLSFVSAIERAEGGKNGYSSKQLEVRGFCQALRGLDSFKSTDSAFTINA